jgi:tungstate transport system ATP-binding protein
MSALDAYELEALTHCYGDRAVLHLDRLQIAPGELLVLLGPTGAGKSTLLRLLAAVERPTGGSLRLGRCRLDEGEPPLDVRRRLAMVFQRPLMLTGSVRTNVEYGLRLRGSHRSGSEELLERLGLTALADRAAHTLSGGECQLVALARALAPKPDVLLLDEPTAHLDPARVALVEGLVADYRRRGPTVVWATHNLFQARRLAGRVALLLDGRLVEVAASEDFFTNPKDPRAAAFVRGEMIY